MGCSGAEQLGGVAVRHSRLQLHHRSELESRGVAVVRHWRHHGQLWRPSRAAVYNSDPTYGNDFQNPLNLITTNSAAVRLSVGNNGDNTTFWGTIASNTYNTTGGITGSVSGTLVKVGTGTLTLAGYTHALTGTTYAFSGNTYAGGAQINTGTLNIDGDGELGVGTSPLSFTGTAGAGDATAATSRK